MSHICVSLHFFLSIIDCIDHRSMVFPTEIITYLLQSSSEILLRQEHEDLPGNSYFSSSGFRFEFIDSDIVILRHHIYEISKILDAFGVGLDSFLCVVHLLL